MAKKQADPNQISLPGVEMDDQEKFDFAAPGGAKKPRKSNGKARGAALSGHQSCLVRL